MSTHSSLKSYTSSPLESIPERTPSNTGALDALPPSAYAYASSAKTLHSSSSPTSHPSRRASSKTKSDSKKKKKDEYKGINTMTAEERMASLLQFKAEKEKELE
jgi:hypothetical protein